MSIQIEQVRQKGVTASAKFDGFQTGVKAPLLLVQERQTTPCWWQSQAAETDNAT